MMVMVETRRGEQLDHHVHGTGPVDAFSVYIVCAGD